MNLTNLNLPPLFYSLLPFIVLVDLVLRGLSLWKSAIARQKWWFIALLVVNSLGILPLIYLVLHRKPNSPQPEYLPPTPSGRMAKKSP